MEECIFCKVYVGLEKVKEQISKKKKYYKN